MIRKHVSIFFLLFSLEATAQPDRLVFDNVSIVDVVSGRISKHQRVEVEGGKIRSVKVAAGPLAPGVQVIDAKGKFMVPGFWDMHVHILVEEGYKWQLPLYLANGVTGLREMWGRDMKRIDSLRGEMKAGRLPFFHLTGPGHIIDGKKVYWPGELSAPDTVTAIRLVDSLAEANVDFIKVYSFLEPAVFNAIARRCLEKNIRFVGHVPHRVWVTDAARAGMATMEHLYGFLIEGSKFPDSAMRLKKIHAGNFEAGVEASKRRQQGRSAESFFVNNFSAARMKEIARTLRKYNSSVVPTLVMNRGFYFANDSLFTNDPRVKYMSSVTRSFWKESITAEVARNDEEDWKIARKRYELEKKIIHILHSEKVMLMTGTDADMPYAFPGFGVHDEMQLFVEAGVKPIDALRASTINPLIYLKMTDSLGRIKKDMRADFVLLDENPLANISATRKIFGVMSGGKYYDAGDLEKLKEKVLVQHKF